MTFGKFSSYSFGLMNKVHQILAEKLIKSLDKGVAPWTRPWSRLFPRNAVSGHKYKGYNLLLASVSPDYGFITYNQAKQSKGLRIKSEELSNPYLVTYFQNKMKDKKTGEEKDCFFLRFYKVFGLSQCEESEELAKLRAKYEGEQTFEDVEKADADLAQVKINRNSTRAFYCPSTHEISLPSKAQFRSGSEYYKTAFHELTHYLAREVGTSLEKSFGTDPYAREELVAEIGANLFASHYGIDVSESFDNSIAYLQGWKNKIEGDSEFPAKAAKEAQKRFDYWLEHYAK